MRFVVAPHNLRFNDVKGIICTDDYTEDEIVNNRHINDIRNDFNDIEFRKMWSSNLAFVYPCYRDEIDLNKYTVITLA